LKSLAVFHGGELELAVEATHRAGERTSCGVIAENGIGERVERHWFDFAAIQTKGRALGECGLVRPKVPATN
jgi:hypothetical protein